MCSVIRTFGVLIFFNYVFVFLFRSALFFLGGGGEGGGEAGYGKSSKISNIFLFLFPNKMLVFRAVIHPSVCPVCLGLFNSQLVFGILEHLPYIVISPVHPSVTPPINRFWLKRDFFIFDRGYSYLAQLLPMVCRLHRKFQGTDKWPWNQRTRSHIHKICPAARNAKSPLFFFYWGCSYLGQWLHMVCLQHKFFLLILM